MGTPTGPLGASTGAMDASSEAMDTSAGPTDSPTTCRTAICCLGCFVPNIFFLVVHCRDGKLACPSCSQIQAILSTQECSGIHYTSSNVQFLVKGPAQRNVKSRMHSFCSSKKGVLLVRVFKRTKSNTVVLAGLSGSGKTILFYQLRDGTTHQGTVTSIEPNEGSFVLHSESEKPGKIKPVHIIDVPGHSRLRPKLDEFLPQACGIIFVVDALDFLPNCRAAAEYLYDILTKATVVKRKIPVLIVCNKTDKVSAHSKDFIRKQLEKEVDKLRATRTGASAADIADEFTLGVYGEAFVFSQCHNKVTIAEASGLTGETSQVEQFIREHVRP